MNSEIFREIDSFVTSTSGNINLRHDDSMIISGSGKTRRLDNTGFEIVKCLYEEKSGAAKTVDKIHELYGTKKNIIVKDLSEIVKSLSLLIDSERKNFEIVYPEIFRDKNIEYPSSAEISLTYRCQNRCDFCSSSDTILGKEPEEMTTQQVKLVIDIIHNDIKASSISFTGGEPSLRKDLPELIGYAAGKGIRTILLTNGIRCADYDFVKTLSDSGLRSAIVSLESDNELVHNRITGNIESFKKTVQGIHNLMEAGIQTNTNTTVCRTNMKYLVGLVKFVRDEFGAHYLSMNMITNRNSRSQDDESISYTSISDIMSPVFRFCRENNIKLEWNTPAPYCMFDNDFNPATGFCSCMSDSLSINPVGEVIPCLSYSKSIGNLLNERFDTIWNSDEALYFRKKKYIPPLCKRCGSRDQCRGGCPLYWSNAGSFKELKKAARKRSLLGKFF